MTVQSVTLAIRKLSNIFFFPLSPGAYLPEPSTDTTSDLRLSFRHHGEHDSTQHAQLYWTVWTARNDLIFQGIQPSMVECRNSFRKELRLLIHQVSAKKEPVLARRMDKLLWLILVIVWIFFLFLFVEVLPVKTVSFFSIYIISKGLEPLLLHQKEIKPYLL